MSPRRHLFFCLIALAAIAGCKTRITQTLDTAVAGTGQDHGSHSARQGARHGEQNAAHSDANPINQSGEPTTSPRPPDVPLFELQPPSDTPSKAVVKVKPLPKEKPLTPDSRPSPPTTPPKPARLTVAAVTPPAAEPAHAGCVSLATPPVAPTAPRPVARLTLGEQPLQTAAPKSPPRPVGLPGLITAAPTTAPAQRLTAVIPASSLSELQPAQLPSQSIDLFARLASPQVIPGFLNQPQPLRLPLAAGTTTIQTTHFNQPLMSPLPDAAPVLWQTKGMPVASIPVLSQWLFAPAAPPPPNVSTTREDRAVLHDKIYQFLIGHP